MEREENDYRNWRSLASLTRGLLAFAEPRAHFVFVNGLPDCRDSFFFFFFFGEEVAAIYFYFSFFFLPLWRFIVFLNFFFFSAIFIRMGSGDMMSPRWHISDRNFLFVPFLVFVFVDTIFYAF